MAAPAVLNLRPASEADRSTLANLLHFEIHVHRHLDWRRPLDWLGFHPYLVIESGARISAALACPMDPPGIAWVRLFAVASRMDPAQGWTVLWNNAREELLRMGAEQAAAIPLQEWFRKLLVESSFEHTHNVVVLDWETKALQEVKDTLSIRPMLASDLPAVQRVDASAFAPLWQNSLEALELAFGQSGFAAVIEEEGRILAYQISTHASQGLHLARLATHKDAQGRGLASGLIQNLQQHVIERGENRLTVNTQDNNKPSLSLYKKLGFELTNEQFPVYQLQLD
jgi:ribosomal protein S18 acetylase RimI-like enzyme